MESCGKNAKMEKLDLSINTYVQYLEDFKIWILAAGNFHRLPEKDIVIFLSEIFREEIYSRSCETLVDVMAETRHKLANYRDIIEISERIKRPEPKKDAKDRTPDAQVSRKQGSYNKAPPGASFGKDAKVSNSTKRMDLKIVECFKGTMPTSILMQRPKTEKAFSRSDSLRSRKKTKIDHTNQSSTF